MNSTEIMENEFRLVSSTKQPKELCSVERGLNACTKSITPHVSLCNQWKPIWTEAFQIYVFLHVKDCLCTKQQIFDTFKFVFGRIESIVRKEKMLVTSICPFTTMFTKGLLLKVVKSWICVVKGICFFVCGFMPYRHYFSYLMATDHKSMYSGLFLTST